MKTILSALAIAAASTALAVESSNTFGILRVDSDKAQTIVSIPWTACGTGGAIKVKDVVKTANLTKGDQLYYYCAITENPVAYGYKMWSLTDSGWEGSKLVANGVTPTAGSDEDTLARGGALILVRQNPTEGDPAVAKPFYLYGQVAWSTAENTLTTTIAASAKTLLAPPTDKNVDLNNTDYVTWTGVAAGDVILLSNGTMLQWNSTDSKWGTLAYDAEKDDDVFTYTDAVLVAGQGAWYARQGETGASVTWKKLPNVASPVSAE